MTEWQSGSYRRAKPGAGFKAWMLFMVAGLLLCVRLGFEYARYADLRDEATREELKVQELRSRAEAREREFKRLSLDKGREERIRNYGGRKPGEIPLPPPPIR